jgi:hypothetical protein
VPEPGPVSSKARAAGLEQEMDRGVWQSLLERSIDPIPLLMPRFIILESFFSIVNTALRSTFGSRSKRIGCSALVEQDLWLWSN